MPRILAGLLLFGVLVCGGFYLAPVSGQEPPRVAPETDPLKDFHTVETAIVSKLTKSMSISKGEPGFLGVYASADSAGKPIVADVQRETPADRAGLQAGDRLMRVAGTEVDSPETFANILRGKSAGEKIDIEVERHDKMETVSAVLVPASRPLDSGFNSGGNGGFDIRKGGNTFKRSTYNLAIVQIDFPDAKHNEAIESKNWEDAFFSAKTYTKKNVTGQQVFGSLRDFYQEQSYGYFTVSGKAFAPVLLSKKRLDYDKSTKRTDVVTEALDLLLARDGKSALDKFDGLFFVYSGDRAVVARGSVFWPHKGTFAGKTARWNYVMIPEGGAKMTNISVACHEFGHMLGLPDLYAAPERPGSEGVGLWSLMSQQAANGRPQHMDAWCKEQLGWLKPVVLDPSVKQKLILSPVYKSSRECYKIPLRADGSEYLLLENRTAQGFDVSLPAHGLFIWRVVGGRPLLVESHGLSGPAGPRAYPASVPYPSKSNDALTPFTVPSSLSHLGGGLPAYITNIHKLPDERITFFLGWEFI